MATLSSTLAWKIPWTEEPSGLQSTVSQRVGHDWVTSLSLFTVQNSMKYFVSVILVFLDIIIIIIIDEKTEIQRILFNFPHVILQAAHSKNRLESD